jgi:ABC-type multidrug transport system fused ATPase/permease subunit
VLLLKESEAFVNTTVLIIAHRLSTIEDIDLILVMKDGKILEQGKAENLDFFTDENDF